MIKNGFCFRYGMSRRVLETAREGPKDCYDDDHGNRNEKPGEN